MAPFQYYHDQYELTQSMPCAAERVRVIRNLCAQTDGTKRGDGVEEDGVQVEA